MNTEPTLKRKPAFGRRTTVLTCFVVALAMCLTAMASCSGGGQQQQQGSAEGSGLDSGSAGNNGVGGGEVSDADGLPHAGDATSQGGSGDEQAGAGQRGEVLSIQEQLSRFRQISDNLPLDDVESATDLLRAFKALANTGIPNDDLFFEYEETMQVVSENLNSTIEEMDSISDDLVINALENGFLFVSEEEYPHFILRADFFCDTFFEYVSEPAKSLLMLRKKHYLFAEGHDLIENSTLMISWDQLAEMITDWEGFLGRHRDLGVATYIEDNVDYYLKLYIGSVQIDNSGLFDHVGDDPSGEPILVLSEEPRESYRHFTENYADSGYYPIVKGLLDVYSESDFVYSEKIVEFFESNGLDMEW